MSALEGVFSRGDRRLCGVLECAFLKGARFDNWSDLLNIGLWQEAFAERSVDFDSYLRERAHDFPSLSMNLNIVECQTVFPQ